jgi:SnoaL-like domain
VPWTPDLFSAPVIARLEEERGQKLHAVPYYAGLLTGETDALIGSFAGEPELHDPIRGRVKGGRAFAAYATEVKRWLEERNVSIEHGPHINTAGRGVEEDVVQLDSETGRVDVPVAIAADLSKGRMKEIRIYHSTWGLTGRHVNRPPLLQPDPELREPDVVAKHQAALAAGDSEAIVDMFEPEAYVREPAGGDYVHRGHDGIGGFYEWLFSNGGGIPLEHCAITDDERACALEYNVVRWGRTELRPEAGIAVYVRGDGDKLAAARIYDDADPPLEAPG